MLTLTYILQQLQNRDATNLYLSAPQDDDSELEILQYLLRNAPEEVQVEFPQLGSAAPLTAYLDALWNDTIEEMDPAGLGELEACSVVGLSCLRLIIRTDHLLQSMCDLDYRYMSTVRAACVRQCMVYLHG